MIKAIVLTFDRVRAVTMHMLAAHDEVWPGHPLHFRIPFQIVAPPDRRGIEPIRSRPGIKDTVLALLEGLGDGEWVYWCIDDKYPISGEFGGVAEVAAWLPPSPIPRCRACCSVAVGGSWVIAP